MKHRAVFVVIAIAAIAAIVVAQRRKAQANVGPDAIVHFIADTEHELSRLPAQSTRMSDAEEIAIGDQIARDHLGELGDQGNTPMAEYVGHVGREVAARAHRKLPYTIHFVQDDTFVNAFALPGGHVFIGSGLVNLMDTEDELASVLGHEVEHIDHYHCAERYQLEARLRRIGIGDLAGIAELPLSIFRAGYSKDQELEADREGTRLAVMAGYSPLGAVRLFEAFERMERHRSAPPATPADEATRIALGTLSGYFQSHPYAAERKAQIERMIASEGWGAKLQEKPLEMGGVNASRPPGTAPMIGNR
ncbi:MAG: M48 family metalloprotease [Candidatus Koribacter versatilis]|uniref:M48 family metalloprotease n=1 Tax=Candidatus Korobacter versatilis TaxID=658062 RepID=A0A932EP60_9BACT|nr:M48 family metalloprotease [Candidatus Koribacter versatilis]